MTKEEQAELRSMARELAKSTGASEEAFKGIQCELQSANSNLSLIRSTQTKHGEALAAVQTLCVERGKNIDGLSRCVAKLQERAMSEPGFDGDDLTPPPTDICDLHSAASQPDKKQPKESFWQWMHTRTSAIVSLFALIVILGGFAYWMVRAYQILQVAQAALIRVTDSGAQPPL